MKLNSLVLTRTAASLLWLTVLFCLAVPHAASGRQQVQNPWTWRNNKGDVKSREDLDGILDKHKHWLDSNGLSGEQADLSGVHLTGAYMTDAHLEHAKFEGADLSHAHLGGADLSEALLAGAHLDDAHLEQADLSGAHLTGAYMTDAHLENANLKSADLSGANLRGSHLQQADLDKTYLDFVRLQGADLHGAYFEPASFPELLDLAQAHGLEGMTYRSNPSPLAQLREQFQHAGFREQERAVICALNRAEARAAPIERWLRWIAFDLTSRYGLSPWRPLCIVGLLWFLLSWVYALFIHRPGPLGIYVVVTRRWRGTSSVSHSVRIRPREIPISRRRSSLPRWLLRSFFFRWLLKESRVVRIAMFFSLMSASNIGFHEINFGQWLRILTRYDYDLRAIGWVRTVSGVQSLISVYLVGLSVLTYFGRPFA